MTLQDEETILFEDKSEEDEDDCNMCGRSGYLDVEQEHVCPNCNGTGVARVPKQKR